MAHGRKIAVIGLGYVGLPVAVAFARSGTPVVGYDIDPRRVAELAAGRDRTREVAATDLASTKLEVTADAARLSGSDFFIVAVPTPIDDSNRPDLSLLLAASRTVGKALKKGAIVVYESTVYPGVTEDACAPVLERASGLKCGRDFTLGYSPERINPGDETHRFETIAKVVAGQDAETLEIVAAVYGSVVTAGVYRAASIKVAEAAKVIENTQRDVNIALMNEVSAICHRLGIDTKDVLDAARTKWNFLSFTPGLVGGHCIGVDPYYLTHAAERAGHHPEVILVGRRTNDAVGERIAQECARLILSHGRRSGVVTIFGLTFKENVPDIRNSQVVEIVRGLEGFGFRVQVSDPLAAPADAEAEYGIALIAEDDLEPADAVILAVPHVDYAERGWALATAHLEDGRGIVIDVRAMLDGTAKPEGITLWRL
jgi:UDP-N-acetyl-D-galactosamine dehydrogenase